MANFEYDNTIVHQRPAAREIGVAAMTDEVPQPAYATKPRFLGRVNRDTMQEPLPAGAVANPRTTARSVPPLPDTGPKGNAGSGRC